MQIPSEMPSSIRSNQKALSSCPLIHHLGKICQTSFVKQERQARVFFFPLQLTVHNLTVDHYLEAIERWPG